MVPRWIPPGPNFWAYATAVAFLLAAIAILSRTMDVIACRLLTVMIFLFGALIWFPAVFVTRHVPVVWFGNAINLMIMGAAWVAADALDSSTTPASHDNAPARVAGAARSHADV